MTTTLGFAARLSLHGLAATVLIAASVAQAQAPFERPMKDGASPRPMLRPPPAKAAAPLAPAPSPAGALEPAWPLSIEIAPGESTGASFVVTRSGPIHITLQAPGGPLVLSLLRPDGRSIERSGSGTVQLDDTASDADIQRGVVWRIGVRTQQAAKPTSVGNVKKAAPPAVAGGSLNVQHPGADPARARAALDAAAKSAQLQQRAKPGAAAVPDAQQVQRQAQRQLDVDAAQRHAATLAQLRTSLPSDVQSQLQQRITLRLQGQSLQQAANVAPVRLITGPTVNTNVAPVKIKEARGGLLPAPTATGPSTATTSGAATGAAPVGSAGGAAAAAAAPLLASTSVNEGDPGTPLSLAGSGFGDAPGEVHFIVGSARDVAAPLTYWSAAQIVTEVPYADGLPVYEGHVYVKRADGQRSGLRPFRFLPVYDVTTIGVPVTKMEPHYATFDTVPQQIVSDVRLIEHPATYSFFDSFFGSSGYVEYYKVYTHLKNGWLVDSAAITYNGEDRPFIIIGTAGAYITELRAGTDSPYVKVRWWRDAGGVVAYDLRITVKRPRNLPCANPCAVL